MIRIVLIMIIIIIIIISIMILLIMIIMIMKTTMKLITIILCVYIYIYIYRGGGLRSRAVSGIAKGTMASLGVFERVTCILGDFTPSKRYPARVEPMIMQDLSKRNGRREIGRGPESS